MSDQELSDRLLGIATDRMPLNGDIRPALLKLPRGLRVLETTSDLDGEVTNGGFDKYFFECDAGWIREVDLAVADFDLIGDVDRAAIAGKALRIHLKHPSNLNLKDGPVTDKQLGWRIWYVDLDGRYSKVKTDLTKLQMKYIRSHPESLVR